MANLEHYYERNDAQVWAHPELQAFYSMFIDPNSPSANLRPLFEEGVPFEERKARRDQICAAFAANMTDGPEGARRVMVPGCDEEPDAPAVLTTIVEPSQGKKDNAPCVLFIGAGGLYMYAQIWAGVQQVADALGAVVVAPVGVRTIFDGGNYPHMVNDVHAAYKWVIENADDLGIDAGNIVLMGTSSGGHLALSLSHRLKRHGYHPRACFALNPIVDPRGDYPSAKREYYGWAGENVRLTSEAWLSEADPSTIGPEAFAGFAAAEDCVGLPPTFIYTSEHDPQADACMVYASKLIEAGVYTSLKLWAGSEHSSLIMNLGMPDEMVVPYAQRFVSELLADLRDATAYDLRRL